MIIYQHIKTTGFQPNLAKKMQLPFKLNILIVCIDQLTLENAKSLQDTDIILVEAAKACSYHRSREVGGGKAMQIKKWGRYDIWNWIYPYFGKAPKWVNIHLNSSVRQILERRRFKHVFTICFSNMWHQPVARLLPASMARFDLSFFQFFTKQRAILGKYLKIHLNLC